MIPRKLRDRSRPRDLQLSRVQLLLIAVTLVLGFLQVWQKRYQVGVDIISYLDLGDAYFRRDWHTALISSWPPLYAWLLGFVLTVLKPSAFWQYPVVQLLNYFVFILTVAAFCFFLREFREFRRSRYAAGQTPESFHSAEVSVTIIAFALFIWCCVELIQVSLTNPDMTVAALLFLAFGLMLRAARGRLHKFSFAVFGAALGLAYLAKSGMFALAFVFLAILAWIAGRKNAARTILAFLTFVAVSGPFIGALSMARHRLTYSDQGWLYYGLLVNGARFNVHWQGEGPAKGTPIHPTTKLLDHPEVFEFATPIKATYPPYYANSYWYEGLQTYFDLKQQARVIKASAQEIGGEFLFGLDGTIVAAAFLLLWFASDRRLVLHDMLPYWILLVPSAAALGMFSLVHVESRYIAPFVVAICLVIICGPASFHTRLLRGTAILMLAMSIIVTYPETTRAIWRFATKQSMPAKNIAWQIADRLRQMGLRPGDRVASVNWCEGDVARWARLARVTIVAEIPVLPGSSDSFWNASAETQRRIMDLYEKTGAVLVISNEKPRGATTGAWIELGIQDNVPFYKDKADYYVFLLPAIGQSRPVTHIDGEFL